MERDQVLQNIIALEWEMFHTVENIGGTASCQEDPGTFAVMRLSQLVPWSDEIRESYLNDLIRAKSEGRNLMTEKYARMMEYTSKEEYERIKDQLPELSGEASLIANRLTDITVRWAEEFRDQFPFISNTGRPIRNAEESPYVTSLETYTRGELLTYGLNTLRPLDRFYREKEARGESLYKEIIQNTVKQLGFDSLAQAEESQRSRRNNG